MLYWIAVIGCAGTAAALATTALGKVLVALATLGVGVLVHLLVVRMTGPRRRVAIGAAITIAVLFVGVVIFRTDPGEAGSAVQGAAATATAPSTAGNGGSEGAMGSGASPDDSLVVATTWPVGKGCDGATSIAMPPGLGNPQDYHSTKNIRSTLVQAGGGAWIMGTLTVDLSAGPGKTLSIQDIQPHVLRTDIGAPLWVYEPDGGCGGSTVRMFKLGLDKPMTFTDEGVQVEGEPTTPPNVPDAPLGPGLTLNSTNGAELEILTTACQGNYEWNVTIKYLVSGDSNVHESTVGPFRSYGFGDNTTAYHGQDPSGSVSTSRVETINGAACTRP